MKNHLLTPSLLALASSLAHAGTLGTPVLITDDADSGVDNSLTYTHTLDLGNGPGTTINGISFSPGLNLGPIARGLDGINGWVSTAPNSHPGNPNTGVTPGTGINDLLTDMRFGGSPASLQFTGLTPGTTYTSRIYYRQWGAGFNREHDLTFSEDGGNSLISVATIDQDATSTANFIDYTYTAQASPLGGAYPLEVLFSQTANTGANGTWHLYGASNHVVAGVHEAPLVGTVTSDNHYAVYLGGADGSNMRYVGRDNVTDWQTPEAHAMDYQPGDHIYIAAWDNPGAVNDPQMVIGSFDLPGGGILGTNAIDWEAVEGPAAMNPGNNLDPSTVFSASDAGDFVGISVFAPVGAAQPNTAGPWGGNAGLVNSFAGTASEFVWLDTFDNVSITNTNESVAIFRTINPVVPVPEPSTILLSLTAAGLVLRRRR